MCSHSSFYNISLWSCDSVSQLHRVVITYLVKCSTWTVREAVSNQLCSLRGVSGSSDGVPVLKAGIGVILVKTLNWVKSIKQDEKPAWCVRAYLNENVQSYLLLDLLLRERNNHSNIRSCHSLFFLLLTSLLMLDSLPRRLGWNLVISS